MLILFYNFFFSFLIINLIYNTIIYFVNKSSKKKIDKKKINF